MSAGWIACLDEFEVVTVPRGVSALTILDAQSRLLLAVKIIRTGRGTNLVEAFGHVAVAVGIPETIGFGMGKDSLRNGLANAMEADQATPGARAPEALDKLRFRQLFRRHYWNPDPRVVDLSLRGSKLPLERWRELQLRRPGGGLAMRLG